MLSNVFSRTMATIKERWLAILLATLASIVPLLVAMAVLIPVVLSTVTPDVKTSGLGDTSTLSTDAGALGGADPVGAGDLGATIDGQPVDAPALGLTPDATTGLGAASVEVERPGIGAIVMVLAIMVVFGLLSLAMATVGVFAAAGSGVKDALVMGAKTSPHAVAQSFLLAWPAVLAYMAGYGAFLMGKFLIGAPLLLVGAVLAIRVSGMVTVAIGSLAHGHVSFTPELAREATRGRVWTAAGTSFVGSLVGGACSFVPLMGPIFMSAFISSMWKEFGEGTSPTPGMGGDPTGGADDPYAQQAHVADSAAGAMPAAAAVAAAATPAASPYVAGPTWYAEANPAEPVGGWIQLAAPATIALQVQWVAGAAPVVHLADAAGAWRAPSAQPTTTGATTAIDLPAGATWVAIVPAEPQQLWASTWIPGAAAMPHAA